MKDIINRRDYLAKKELNTITNIDEKNIFTQQRRRLTQQLSDFPYYNSPSNTANKKSIIKTRKQSKKQKKINSVLKEINSIYENDSSLKEDTNLRLLKNMSRVREYKKSHVETHNSSSYPLFLKELDNKNTEKDKVGMIPVLTKKELEEEKIQNNNAYNNEIHQKYDSRPQDKNECDENKKLYQRKKIKKDNNYNIRKTLNRESITEDIKRHDQSLRKCTRLNKSIIFLSVIFLIILIALFFTMITYLNI